MVIYDFTLQEWKEIFSTIDFTDEEKKIINFRRRGWRYSDIAAELYISERQLYRKKKKIENKIKRMAWD